MKISQPKTNETGRGRGFTLIELLVVISIMGVLAGFTIPALKSLKIAQYKKVARGELEQIQTALDNYKAKYGFYPPASTAGPLTNQLYYELSGTTDNGSAFVTLDGASRISHNVNPANSDVFKAFGVEGFVSCTKGSAEDDAKAKNFLPALKAKNIGTVQSGSVGITNLVTSLQGPDQNYNPLNVLGSGPFPNPIRYVYPGTHNPGGYDLWIQFQVGGKKYLVCNWSRQVQINSSLP